MISILVAYDQNHVIGKQNDLPWYLPADLKRFKRLTVGHSVLMGRKTFESIIRRLGGPLPDRNNVVLTRDVKFQYDGVTIVNDLDTALMMTQPEGEVFVIGGAEVFRQCLPLTDKLYVTEVQAAVDGDVFFPEVDGAEWDETAREEHQADEKNLYAYDFVIYERKQ